MNNSAAGLHSGFFAHAELSPDSPALQLGLQKFTYSQLRTRSLEIAAALPSRARIGVLGPKSFEVYAGILGSLAAGSAYVALDPDLPQKLLLEKIKDADLHTLLVAPGIVADEIVFPRKLLLDQKIPLPPLSNPLPISEDTTAYLIYTSGSSGRPKGIQISHASCAALLQWAGSYFKVSAGTRFSGIADLGFDLSVLETFFCWHSGGCLVPPADSREKAMPHEYLRNSRVSFVACVPSVFQIIHSLRQLRTDVLQEITYLAFIGEPLSPGLVQELSSQLSPSARLFNMYGPTEATVACSSHEIARSNEDHTKGICIGWNTGETSISILKEDSSPAEIGEQGEIFVSGPQVAKGYWNNPEESSLRFLTLPDGQKYFRTGDIAEVTKLGPICLGRRDEQVKILGRRIELGEIEAALNAISQVTAAAVVAVENPEGLKELLAFACVKENFRVAQILASLQEKIPAHMLPSKITILDSMPLAATGKIDKRALREKL